MTTSQAGGAVAVEGEDSSASFTAAPSTADRLRAVHALQAKACEQERLFPGYAASLYRVAASLDLTPDERTRLEYEQVNDMRAYEDKRVLLTSVESEAAL